MIKLRWLQRGAEADQAPPANSRFTIIALHGWAADGDVWQPLGENCPEFDIAVFDLPGFGQESDRAENSLDQLVGAMASAIRSEGLEVRQFVLVGWSLGGQLAAKLAEQLTGSNLAPQALITAASNPCFVAKESWPDAMAPEKFDAFVTGFNADFAATVTRFHRLQERGALDKRQLRSAMKTLPNPTQDNASSWACALEWLRLDTRKQLANLPMPQLHILAEGDALVPSSIPLEQFGEVHRLNSSHCLPLEAASQLARSIKVFLASHSACARSKSQVAKAFSEAASRYDSFAKVQKTVAQNVASMAIANLKPGQRVLDLGVGTGTVLKQLHAAETDINLVGVDIAEGMVREAKASSSLIGQSLLVADIEMLPFADGCVDLAVSSLAMQWCDDLPNLFAEIYRVLKPGAKAVLATLGPQTLAELKAAWRAVDAAVHVNGFASAAAVTQFAEMAGLKVSLLQQTEQLVYAELMPLLRELKAIGAHNMHSHARQGLMTKSTFAALTEAYARLPSGEFAATYDVYYLTLEKPHG